MCADFIQTPPAPEKKSLKCVAYSLVNAAHNDAPDSMSMKLFGYADTNTYCSYCNMVRQLDLLSAYAMQNKLRQLSRWAVSVADQGIKRRTVYFESRYSVSGTTANPLECKVVAKFNEIDIIESYL